MLLEIQVAALADLAIRHLPKISEARKNFVENGWSRLGDEYLLQRAPTWVCCDPLSGAIERQAAHLLELTQLHPTRTHEVVTAWHPVEGEILTERELPLPRNLPERLEPAIFGAVDLLCKLSGEPLPPWIQNTASLESINGNTRTTSFVDEEVAIASSSLSSTDKHVASVLPSSLQTVEKSCHVDMPKKTDDALSPPGKVPKVAIGRLAVKAAWEIECESGRKASYMDVLGRLKLWANSGAEPAVLIEANKWKHEVTWVTIKSKKKIYGIEACMKTLEAWHESRRL